MTFNEWIIGKKQEEVVNFLGVSNSYVSNLKYGKMKPNIRVAKILRDIGVVVEDNNTLNCKKDITIEKLTKENKELKQEIKRLNIIIEEALTKVINKLKKYEVE